MNDWIHHLLECRARGQPAMLVTVASVRGSAPREAGARMVVTGAGQWGTIGGGNLEAQATAIALDRLAASGQTGIASLRRFPLGASLGQCCGGSVTLMFEPVSSLASEAGWLDAVAAHAAAERACVVVSAAGRPARSGVIVVGDDAGAPVDGSLGSGPGDAAAIALARDLLGGADGTRLINAPVDGGSWLVTPVRPPDFTVLVFGAGHVGSALVRLLAECPCRIVWVDPRPDAFPADLPARVQAVVTEDPVERVDQAPPGGYFLVMTHSHALDEALALRILQRDDVAWFGLIGSATKRRRFEHRLGAQGIPGWRLAEMACPIGLAGIPGKEPAVVAVSVAAQLLQLRARHRAAGAAPSAPDPQVTRVVGAAGGRPC